MLMVNADNVMPPTAVMTLVVAKTDAAVLSVTETPVACAEKDMRDVDDANAVDDEDKVNAKNGATSGAVRVEANLSVVAVVEMVVVVAPSAPVVTLRPLTVPAVASMLLAVMVQPISEIPEFVTVPPKTNVFPVKDMSMSVRSTDADVIETELSVDMTVSPRTGHRRPVIVALDDAPDALPSASIGPASDTPVHEMGDDSDSEPENMPATVTPEADAVERDMALEEMTVPLMRLLTMFVGCVRVTTISEFCKIPLAKIKPLDMVMVVDPMTDNFREEMAPPKKNILLSNEHAEEEIVMLLVPTLGAASALLR